MTDQEKPRRRALDLTKDIADPSEYFVASPKEGLPVSTRVDKAMKQRIAEIVQSGVTSFKTEADLTRAALFHFMEKVLLPRMNDRDVKQLSIDRNVPEALRLNARKIVQKKQDRQSS